ncbi:unnamed protein product [Symbiodinium sp. KB8]|nr:unnamed protein product [Symbiodinium sp. KB8]
MLGPGRGGQGPGTRIASYPSAAARSVQPYRDHLRGIAVIDEKGLRQGGAYGPLVKRVLRLPPETFVCSSNTTPSQDTERPGWDDGSNGEPKMLDGQSSTMVVDGSSHLVAAAAIVDSTRSGRNGNNGPKDPSVEINDPETTGATESEATPLRPGDLVRGIQKYVTAARKAEVKTRKATEERELILARWHKYQAELQATFVQERNNFKKDLMKNQEELDRLQAAQMTAFQDLKDAFDNPETMMAKPETSPPEDAVADWEQLLQTCEDEDVDMTEAMAERLGQSLRAFLANRAPRTPARRRVETEEKSTPPRPRGTTRRSPLPTLDEFMESSLGIARKNKTARVDEKAEEVGDPYLLSPSNRPPTMPSPGARSTSRPRGSTPRVPIKLKGRLAAPSPKPGSALAKRLEAKRKAALEATATVPVENLDTDEDECTLLGDLNGGPKEEEDAILTDTGDHYQGLCRYVPMSPVPFPQATCRHGPSGGHVRARQQGGPSDCPKADRPVVFFLYDILDFFEALDQSLHGWWICYAVYMEVYGCGILLTLALLSLLEMWWLLWEASPKPRALRSKCRLHPATVNMWKAALVMTVLPGVYAGPQLPRENRLPEDAWPTDLELWAAGQRTLPEQLAAALQRHVLSTPLRHSSGTADPPNLVVVPPDLLGEPHVPAMDERALHVTIWVAAVFYEAETLDIEMARPLTLPAMKAALRGACNIIPDSLDEFHPTVPQLGDYYGSFVAQPVWLRNTNRTTLVLDARAMGGVAFPFYQEGRVNLETAARQLPEFHETEVDFYVFGRLTPLARGQSFAAIPGGVIKAVPQGSQCHWSDLLENRLPHPLRWSPRVDPPGQTPGLHTVFQSATDQVIDEIGDEDLRPLEVVAEEALGLEHGETVVFLPEERTPNLAHAGRTVYEQVAVVNSSGIDPSGPCVVFVDLRPLTVFPQWLQMTTDTFDPRTYIQDLQIQGSEDWVIVVEGGEPLRGGRLRVRHRETLTFMLQPPGSSSEETSDSEGDESDSDDDDGQEDESSDPSIFRSSGSERPPSPSGAPRGPPPAQPIDRSRSPRRRQSQDTNPADADEPEPSSQLQLADHVPAPVHYIGAEIMELPHNPALVQDTFWTWPTGWMSFNWRSLPLKQATLDGCVQLSHWSDLLFANKLQEPLEAHLYTDGSYFEKKGKSGYGIVVLLRCAGLAAIFGIIGGPILGDEWSLWDPGTAPAMRAEQVAIAVALLWIGQSLNFLHLSRAVVHFDCHGAGWAATGDWQASDSFGYRTHGLELFLRSMTRHQLHFEYSRAHIGEPWNEMADVVAKCAALQENDIPSPPLSNCKAFLELDLSWMALSTEMSRAGALDIQAGKWLTIPDPPDKLLSPLTPAQLIPMNIQGGTERQDWSCFHTKCASLNVQGLQNKHRYLDAQLDRQKYQIVFIQETKDRESTVGSRNYLRFSTPSEKHWGVSIWLHRTLGFLTIQGRPLCVVEEDVKIAASDKRLLIIEVQKSGLHIVLISAHVPHMAKAEERSEYLKELEGALRKYRRASLVLGGIDANGRPPRQYAEVTGSLQCGEEDQAGLDFAKTMRDSGLWLPSTYEELHCGPSETFRHPTGSLHRIDFLSLGGRASIDQLCSYVDYEIDLGSIRDDHWPVALMLAGHVQGLQPAGKLWRPRYDRDKMLTIDGRKAIKQAFEKYVPLSSTTHIDLQCQHLQDYLTAFMQEHFPARKGQRSAFIPDEVWRWRADKMAHKKRTQHRKQWKTVALRRAFGRWAQQGSTEPVLCGEPDDLLYQLNACAIGYITWHIKNAIRTHKNNYLKELIAEGPQTAMQLLQRARRGGIGGKKENKAARPLPLLVDKNGKIASSQEDHDELWLRHFGDQESGILVPVEEFLGTEDNTAGREQQVTWQHQDLPTVQDIEDLVRKLPKNKAMGLDGVPGEVLKADPSSAALTLAPLFIQAMTRMAQPLQWRGGVLYNAWKRAGPISQPSSHRSLFISSVVGKLYHRILRQKTHPQLQHELHSMHLGSQPKAPMAYASLYIYSHFRRGLRQGRSTGAMFLDTTSAYYRVLREAVVGDIRCDQTVAWIMKRLGMDGEDMANLYQVIQTGGFMADAGVGAATMTALRDVHHRTWCVSKYTTGRTLVHALAGSRPGESLADAIFAYVYARVLGRIFEQAYGEDLLSVARTDKEEGIFAGPENGVEIPLRDTTWADDTAIPFDDEEPERCISKAKRLAAITISTCQSFGLDPNLKRGKTAIVLAIRGKGAQKARRAFLRGGGASLYLEDLHKEVAIMPQYVHLGGIVDYKTNMKAEAKRRLALAGDALEAGAKLLYANKQIQKETRVKMFETAILATFFNLAIWIPRGEAWSSLCDGYTRLLRRILAPHVLGTELFKLPSPVIHLATGCWRLELQGIKHRCSLLTNMVTNGPDALWAILQAEETWLRTLRADLVAVSAEFKHMPQPTAASWPQWWHFIRDYPGRFKLGVKRYLRKEHERQCQEEVILVGLWGIYREACSWMPVQFTKQTVWSCRACRRTFRSKGGLGAHFFKAHQRLAAYRTCIDGTVCRACCGQFWTSARLGTHLRDNPGCVARLLAKGHYLDAAQPGQGSRAYQRRFVEEFNLAPAIREDQAGQIIDGELWSLQQKDVYRNICAALSERSCWDGQQQLTQTLLAQLATSPLYFQEEVSVIQGLREDIELLGRSYETEQWDADTFELIRQTLQNQDEWLRPYSPVSVETSAVEKSAKDFIGSHKEIDWEPLTAAAFQHVTPERIPYSLDASWEATGEVFSGIRDATAVLSDPLSCVPGRIRELWQLASKGLDTGLANEDSSDKLLGPRKKRIQEPGFSPNVGGALSPRSQGWSGSPRSPSPRTVAMGNLCECCGSRDKGPTGLPPCGSGGNAEHGYALAINDRATMEDAVAIQENVAGYTCLAVFDGHGGDKAATLAQSHLPKQLNEHLQRTADKEQAAIDAFHAVEELMHEELAGEASMLPSGTSSGTVACVALFRDKEVILVNLGDCRAVVCESSKVATTTKDHSPDKNKMEKQRLNDSGVSVESGYVDGKVQVSRALGDLTGKTGHKIRGLMCTPDVTIIEVKDTTEFLILATDGIWDGIQDQTATTTARKVLRETRSPEAAAKAVVEAAGKVTKADNAAVIVLALNVPEPPPKRDPAQSRFRRSSKTETPFGDLPDTPEKEWRPLRRRRPSNENATVSLPPWVLPGNAVSPRSASPRSPRSPRLSSPASPASLWVPEKDRRVTTWTSGYDVDTYRYIKVFPDSIQYKSCLALQPTRSPSPSDVEKAEHDGIWGPDGLLRGSCRRRISPNARGTMSSIAFTPPPSPATDVGSPMSPTVAADKLQGLQTLGGYQGPFPVLGGVPRKRMQPAPDSPSHAAEEASPDTAGMRSPRFSWSSGMVPDRQAVQPQATADDLPRRMAVDAVSPRSLIRPAATLATGLSAEDPDAVNENFLGARKGRSPRGSRTPSPGGAFGGNSPSLSWGAVSAGGYGLDVASRGTAGAWCDRSFNDARPAEVIVKRPRAQQLQSLTRNHRCGVGSVLANGGRHPHFAGDNVQMYEGSNLVQVSCGELSGTVLRAPSWRSEHR